MVQLFNSLALSPLRLLVNYMKYRKAIFKIDGFRHNKPSHGC